MAKKENGNISKNLLKGTLVVGALFGVSSLTAATTSSLYDYEALGSGSELRSVILNNSVDSYSLENAYELKCGEGKCGEGKCGEDAKKAKADAETKSKEAKKKKAECDSKSKEAKCGEGKCGEKKKKAKAECDSKSKEAKCGESKSVEEK